MVNPKAVTAHIRCCVRPCANRWSCTAPCRNSCMRSKDKGWERGWKTACDLSDVDSRSNTNGKSPGRYVSQSIKLRQKGSFWINSLNFRLRSPHILGYKMTASRNKTNPTSQHHTSASCPIPNPEVRCAAAAAIKGNQVNSILWQFAQSVSTCD